MTERISEKLLLPQNIDAAISALQAFGEDSVVLAGGTWVMRAPIRGEQMDKTFVSLARIKGLREITLSKDELEIGCLATHDALYGKIGNESDLQGLKQAVGNSANPSIRRAATIGGNLCASEFAASDIVPALISCKARIEVRSPSGSAEYPIVEFLLERGKRAPAEVVTRVIVPRSKRISTHVRLLGRKAAEYPIANLSASIALDDNREIVSAYIAVGSIEKTARRWSDLENAITGNRLDKVDIQAIASRHNKEFNGRDAADAPGWYRLRVLPQLASKAFEALRSQ